MDRSNYLVFFFLFFTTVHFLSSQSNVDFSASKTSGCGALVNVQFTDLSSGNINSWHWNFGNSITSNSQHPTVSFFQPGKYTVSLTVGTAGGNFTEVKTDYIHVHNKPKSDFNISSLSGCNPLKVDFTNNTLIGDAAIKKYIWDFGDGSPEINQENPNYTYATPGNYQVSLQVIDSNDCVDSKLLGPIVVEKKPLASFLSTNVTVSCSAPFTVYFLNNSYASPNMPFYWDFGDGNSSTQKNPVHTYAANGTYDVTLIASTNLCSDTLIRKSFVSIAPISADFTVSNKKVCIGDSIKFQTNSTGAAAFYWEFGDGKTSRHKNPTKAYADSGTYIVKLRASSGSSCVVNITDTILVQKTIADFSILEDTACTLPATTHFINHSTNGDMYNWYLKGAGTINTFNKDTLTVSFNRYGNFHDTLIAISMLGCRDTTIKSSRLNYQPLPKIDFLNKKNGCVPLSLDFIYSYSHLDPVIDHTWSYNTNNSVLDTVSFLFNDDGADTVYLKVENSRGCFGYDTLPLLLGDSLVLDTIALPDTLCANDTLMFGGAYLDPSKNLTYKAILSTKTLSSPQTIPFDSIFVLITMLDTGMMYITHVVDYNGCITESEKDSIYIKGPITSFEESPSDCNGSLTFNFTSEMKGVDKFFWNFGDGSPVDSINQNPTHTFPADFTYQVKLTAYNKDSSCSSVIEKYVETGPPPVASITYSNIKVCVYDSVVLNASVTNQYERLEWIVDNQFHSSKPSITISKDSVANINVKLVAISKYSCTDTALINLSFEKPTADFTTDYNGGCFPISVNFTDKSVSNNPLIDWRWDISPLGKDSVQNPSIVIDESMVVSANLIVTDTLGCKDTLTKDSIFKVEKNFLDFSINEYKICIGDTVQFTNKSTIKSPNYTWLIGNEDSLQSFDASFVFDSVGIYDVTLKYIDPQNCKQELKIEQLIDVGKYPVANFTSDTAIAPCYPLPVTFTETSNDPSVNYWRWNFGDGNKSSFANPFHNYTLPGTYDVGLIVSTVNGCSDTIVKPNYIQTSGPEATISISSDTACIFNDIVFEMLNDSKVESFQWHLGDSSTSLLNPVINNYHTTGWVKAKLIIADKDGVCFVTLEDSVYITEMKAEFKLSDTSLCVNESIVMTNTTPDSEKVNWSFGDGNNSTTNNPNHLYSKSGKYTIKLMVESRHGCIDSAQKLINIHPIPDISNISDALICYGDTIQLFASGGNNYEWRPNLFLSNPNIPDPLAFPDTSITYSLLVGNQFNCFDSTDVNIEIAVQPISELPDDTNLIVGESLQIYNNKSNAAGYIYSWSPPDGLNCSDCPHPIAQPLSSTLYVLNIQDPVSCYSIYDSLFIEIKEAYSLNVPTAFTPNGDGNNDIIYAKGWGIKELKDFKIYNRWGEVVFETSDINTGWDGTYKGKPQEMETYVYIVRALMFNDEIISKKGNINLIR